MATNIEYNWAQYFSASGTGKPNVKRILKYRQGICVDYAFLMDTLCKLAGLASTSVYGYAKDELFDLADSLYIDNHAWNAVKLDNLWYVYDVTFSTGRRKYELTRFSKFIIRVLKKLPVKNVTIVSLVQPPAGCGGAPDTLIYQFRKYRLKPLWWLFTRFHLKRKFIFESNLNTDFYLCNPDLFAVSHFSDNPTWSLTNSTSVLAFENDSAFYHLTDSAYKTQMRTGRTCAACDNALTLDELKKQQKERDQSLAFNPKNRFYPSICEYYIGNINYSRSQKTEDSLTRVTLLDTALASLERARYNMFRGHTNVETDFALQKTKNRKKYNFLYDENKKHINFLREKAAQSYKERMSLKALEQKARAQARSFHRKMSLVNHFDTEVKAPEAADNLSLIAQCRQKLEKDQKELDSLLAIMANTRYELENALPQLAGNVWQQVYYLDTLAKPFIKSLDYRAKLLDDYKKPIIENCKKICVAENKYAKQIDSLVYSPSQVCLEKALALFRMNDRKFSLQKECYQTRLRLAKLGDGSKDDVVKYKEELYRQYQEEYCWLSWKSKYIKLTYKGLKELKKTQVNTVLIIGAEKTIESQRYKLVSKELLRRRSRYKSIAVNNNHVIKASYAGVKKYKADYLSHLRKLRREANSSKKDE